MPRWLVLALTLELAAQPAFAAMNAAQKSTVDQSVTEWLKQTGVPSASIAIVEDGELVYAKAYGSARLNPSRAATVDTRYAIDSITKQFTASAMLSLQEAGKLSLDDKVSKYFPDLSSADQVTIRQLLSHTAGYQDFWPQDYVTIEMSRPTTTDAILQEWAKKPLEFTPGTDSRYSNTNYVIAGAIVEKVSGQKLFSFLRDRIFAPLKMTGAADGDSGPLSASDAVGYTRYGIGPARAAPKEGQGWMFGSGQLAMTASDLARWDISLMNRSLLTTQSYDALYSSFKLANGTDSHYGLGLTVVDDPNVFDQKSGFNDHGSLLLQHGGGGSGFLSLDRVWPGLKSAIVVLTNSDWEGSNEVSNRIRYILLKPQPVEQRARDVFDGFRHGVVDRKLFTANANAYLTPQVLADQRESLTSVGPVRFFGQQGASSSGGLENRTWMITTDNATLRVLERSMPGGKIEQFTVTRVY